MTISQCFVCGNMSTGCAALIRKGVPRIALLGGLHSVATSAAMLPVGLQLT